MLYILSYFVFKKEKKEGKEKENNTEFLNIKIKEYSKEKN